jgi:alcohol dehydrogenase
MSAVLGALAVGADPVVAVDVAPDKLESALRLGATAAVAWEGGAEETAERVRAITGGGVDWAVEATGRTEAGRAAFLSTRARGAAVLIGIPGADDELRLPALTIPRLERRVLGSVYGSARPHRDIPALIDLYRHGRLPLDRLVTARLPLSEIDEGFELLRGGSALRVVVEPEGVPA